jgi:hypothetical protein
MLGAIDVSAQAVTLTHFDCETGKPWLPPPIAPLRDLCVKI